MQSASDLTLTPLTQEDTFRSWRALWLIDLIYHRSVANQQNDTSALRMKRPSVHKVHIYVFQYETMWRGGNLLNNT